MVGTILVRLGTTAAIGTSVQVVRIRHHTKLHMVLRQVVRPARLGITAQRERAVRQPVAATINTRQLVRHHARQ